MITLKGYYAAMDPLPLTFLLATVGRQASAAFAEVVNRHQVTPREFAVLQSLRTGPAPSQRELAGRLGLPPSRVVALVDRLESAGLLGRSADESDRRTRRLVLTDSGRSTVARIEKAGTELDDAATADLTPEDRQRLTALLGRVSSALAEEGTAAARVW